MKWFRFACVLVLLGMAGCVSPTGPRYPQPDSEDTTEKSDPSKGGMVISPDEGFFV